MSKILKSRTFAHGQPVKLTENWRDVIHSPCFCNQSSGRVLNTLEFRDFFIRETIQETVTAVQFRRLKGVNQFFRARL